MAQDDIKGVVMWTCIISIIITSGAPIHGWPPSNEQKRNTQSAASEREMERAVVSAMRFFFLFWVLLRRSDCLLVAPLNIYDTLNFPAAVFFSSSSQICPPPTPYDGDQ